MADKFSSIKLVVWEKTINVDVNKSYLFTKARVALWTSSVLISPNSVKILSSLNRPSAT